jgi:hypothetical protein
MLTELPIARAKTAPSSSDSVSTVVVKRVHYAVVAPAGAAVLLKFAEPQQRVALLEEFNAGTFPELPAINAQEPTPDFICACLSAPSSDLVSRAETWLDPQGSAAGASVRVKFRQGWARLKPGVAVLCAPREDWEPLLAALADFAFFEFELGQLEQEIASDWGRAENDLPLASDVSSDDLSRVGDVSAMTQLVFMRRIRLAKLERSLEKTQAPLPRHARAFAARLRARFDIAHRAETLDGQIEVYEYVYELANQRMGEYRNFRREYVLEIAIVLLLASELAVMLWEHFTP